MSSAWIMKLLEYAEWIEISAYADMVKAAPRRVRRRLGLEVARTDVAVMFFGRGVRSRSFNRVLGLGLMLETDPHHVDEVVEAFRARGIERFAVQLLPERGPSRVRTWLTGRGITPAHRRSLKMIRGRGIFPGPRHGLRLVPADQDTKWLFARMMLEPLDLAPAAAPMLEALVDRPRWHTLLAYDGDELVGAALSFVAESVAFLVGSTALARAALTHRRTELALRSGCELIVADTEVDPDRPEHEELRELGFRPLTTREDYATPPLAWTIESEAARSGTRPRP